MFKDPRHPNHTKIVHHIDITIQDMVFKVFPYFQRYLLSFIKTSMYLT